MEGSPTKASNAPSDDLLASICQFVGWIPTANGRLSFRHVGDSKHPELAYYVNALGPAEMRHVLVLQRRNLSDLPFEPITPLLIRRTGKFWFAATCTAARARAGSDIDSLQGKLYVFSPTKERIRRGFYQSFKSTIDATNRKTLLPNNQAEVVSDLAAIRSKLDLECDIWMKFSLLRNGMVFVDLPIFKSAELLRNSEEAAVSSGVSFPEWIANQAYFFLRDVCHVHQHHDPSVDTILTLQERTADASRWMNRIAFSMHHRVIKTRRSAVNADLYKAQGVLAYAKAFERLCGIYQPRGLKLSVFQEVAIQESINAKIHENDFYEAASVNKRNVRVARSVGYRTLLVTAVGLIIAVITGITAPYVGAHREVSDPISKYLIDHVFALTMTLLTLFRLAGLCFARMHSYQENTTKTRSREIAFFGICSQSLCCVEN